MENVNQEFSRPFVVAAPFKGDDCEYFLDRLSEKGLMAKERSSDLKQILQREKEGKLMGSREEAMKRLKEYWDLGYTELGVGRDVKRNGAPWRLVFQNYDVQINGANVSFNGISTNLIPAALRAGEARIGLVQWDRFYAVLFDSMKIKTKKLWPDFNKSVDERATDLRILGSVALPNHMDHFIVTNDPYFSPEALQEMPIFIDDSFEGIYMSLLSNVPRENFMPVSNIEKAIATSKKKAAAIALVGTGKTLRNTIEQYRGLFLQGLPVLKSELVYAVDIRKKFAESEPYSIADFLGVEQYGSEKLEGLERLHYSRLVNSLFDYWQDRPSFSEYHAL